MATIRDVAKRAGVSAGTVSNVLNRPSYVSTDIRSKVLQAIAELDFSPTQAARQFRPGRLRTLGVAVADMGNPFFVDVALAADARAKALGVGVVLVHSGEDTRQEQINLDLLVQQRVHGIIITPVDESNPRLEKLIAQGIPLIYVDRIRGDRPVCWVTSDDTAGGRLAAEHLVSLGHERLGFVGGTDIAGQVERRFTGFAAGAAGRPIRRLDAQTWTIAEGHRFGRVIAESDPETRPTAIAFANDMLALGALRELAHAGIRVPEDISIVGYDDLSWAEDAVVPLTTISQHREQLGHTAVDLLLAEIDEGDAHDHKHVTLQPELIVRESTMEWKP